MEIFEVSWEICNKVGGIYTVISSKTEVIKSFCKEHYYIGPYMGQEQKHFEAKTIPQKFKRVFKVMESQGIKCHFGTWTTYGEPKVILLDFSGIIGQKDEIKTKLWDYYKIDSLFSQWEFEEPMLFSTAVARFLDEYAKRKKEIIGHFHEWMSGIALLQTSNIKTVFTTHATMLGRTLAGNGRNLEEEQESIDPDVEARNYNVQDKHLTEKACALKCDVFTTVSDVTAKETEIFFGRKPDVILYNGLDARAFNKFKKNTKVKDLIQNIFGHHYEVKDPFVLFTSGRYEFHGKGMDVLIDTLGELNRNLLGSKKNIVVLFLVPAENWGVKKEYSEENKGLPVNCTHYVRENDPIINAFARNGLDNRIENFVKVIFVPIYINEHDDFFNCHYYDIAACCDMGVFPSKYEPWGYTPLESITLGIPTITTAHTGFGKYVQQFLNNDDTDGVYVLENDNPSEFAKKLELLFKKKNRELNKISAKAISSRCDWKILIKQYYLAYNLALE